MPVRCDLEKVMKAKGISQAELAKATGLRATEVWRYAKGKVEPNVLRALLIARHLGVEVSSIWVWTAPSRRRDL